ncbi:MAG: BlaI/MecI/CopY family transcriptional regulator [Nitriliruptorales bacterium]|nr:BlaI/MecI/CopY family transcriptional regulator [Nitriliruptorales bacterium]
MVKRSDPLETILGPLEQDVMDVIWTLQDATVRDVHDELSQRRKIAYTTVMTTMSRLANKGLLVRDTKGLAHRYRPLISRDSYARSTFGSLLSWLFDRYPESAVSYLAEVVDDADSVSVDSLRRAVERQRELED